MAMKYKIYFAFPKFFMDFVTNNPDASSLSASAGDQFPNLVFLAKLHSICPCALVNSALVKARRFPLRMYTFQQAFQAIELAKSQCPKK